MESLFSLVTFAVLATILRTDRQWRTANIFLGLLLAGSIVPMWR
jgi:hypothetical protein